MRKIAKTDPIVAGNLYNKYESTNAIARLLVQGYLRAFDQLVVDLAAKTILEVGCGEGYITHRLARHYMSAFISAIDISFDVLRQASVQYSESCLACASAYYLPFQERSFQLVVCVETLEHLEAPRMGLDEIKRVCKQYALFSVPQEPIWRVMNLVRGTYIKNCGNTPGHLQHWSVRQFVGLLKEHFTVLQVATPLPWTMVLCKVKEDEIN